MILKLLSTVLQVTFEDANGVVVGRIAREGRGGKEILIGRIPEGPHYQSVHYRSGVIDRSFRTPQITNAAPATSAQPLR